MADYKIGTWIKHKQTGEVSVIRQIFRTNDGYAEMGIYYLLTLDNKDLIFAYDRNVDISDVYELCPAAQLLHGVK